MSGKRSREAVYTLFAKNLSFCFPELKDTFACPICGTLFGKDALEAPPKVILAHCLPASLGGRLKVMACARCDNDGGSQVDVHLKNRFETEDFFQGLSPDARRVWIRFGGHRVRASLKLADREAGQPSFEIVLDKKNSPVTDFESFVAAVDAAKATSEKLTFRVEGAEPWNAWGAKIALLRAAYLMLFRQFGYSCILHPNYDIVRRQLREPAVSIIQGEVAVELKDNHPHLNTVTVVTSPPEHRCFLVPMAFRTEGNRSICRGVIMPGLGAGGDKIYELIHVQQEAGTSFRGAYTVIKYDPGRLSNPESVRLPYLVWQELAS